MGVYERPTTETNIKEEPLTSYHRVENVDIAYNIFLNSSLEIASGYGEKKPRNVRFAHNLLMGEKPDLKIIKPNEVLSEFLFHDNHWAFRDVSLSEIPYERLQEGFNAIASPVDVKQKEKERINACIFTVGPVWYSIMRDNVSHIDMYR